MQEQKKYICWSHTNVPMSMSPNSPTACRRHTEGEAARCKEPAIPSNAQALCSLLIHVESAEMKIDFSSSGLFGCCPLDMCIIRIFAVLLSSQQRYVWRIYTNKNIYVFLQPSPLVLPNNAPPPKI